MAVAGVGGVAALPAAAWLGAAWYNAGQVDDWAKADMITKSGTTVAHMCAAAVQLKLVHLSCSSLTVVFAMVDVFPVAVVLTVPLAGDGSGSELACGSSGSSTAP